MASYSTAPTKATGNVIGATDWNLIVMNSRYMAQSDTDGRPLGFINRATNQTIPNNSATIVTWNGEMLDNAATHSVSTNTSRIVAPVAGWYEIHVMVGWAANGTGERSISILVNGTGTSIAADDRISAAALFGTTQTAMAINHMAANDYIEVSSYQNSGGGLDIIGAGSGFMSMVYFKWIAQY